MATSSVQWQCTKTLPECLLRMLEEEIACDVTFLVGKDTQEVMAHKVILMSRSPVFFSMLEGPLSEKGEITISDIEKESFVEFLKYLYTDEYKPNPNTVMDVLYCAKKYCVDNLSKTCADFLRNNISPENVCTILDAAYRFDEHEIRDACISIFETNTAQCIKSPEFDRLSKKCLTAILDLDKMNCDEEGIYEGIVRWARKECRRQEMENTPENCRIVLGDLLYKVRFATMDPVYFTKHISDSCILSMQEKIDIFKNFHVKEDSSPSRFVFTMRTPILYKVDRFKDVGYYWGPGNFTDKISLVISHNAVLQGVRVYGSSSRKADVTYSIRIKDSRGHSLYAETKSMSTEVRSEIYDILLSKKLQLEKGEKYTIEIDQTPSDNIKMHFGKNGQSTVKYGINKTIKFLSAAGSKHTDVLHGQIPGLILS